MINFSDFFKNLEYLFVKSTTHNEVIHSKKSSAGKAHSQSFFTFFFFFTILTGSKVAASVINFQSIV